MIFWQWNKPTEKNKNATAHLIHTVYTTDLFNLFLQPPPRSAQNPFIKHIKAFSHPGWQRKQMLWNRDTGDIIFSPFT